MVSLPRVLVGAAAGVRILRLQDFLQIRLVAIAPGVDIGYLPSK